MIRRVAAHAGPAAAGVRTVQEAMFRSLLCTGLNSCLAHTWLLVMHYLAEQTSLSKVYSRRSVLREHGLKVRPRPRGGCVVGILPWHGKSGVVTCTALCHTSTPILGAGGDADAAPEGDDISTKCARRAAAGARC
jgi:hypothetical protein